MSKEFDEKNLMQDIDALDSEKASAETNEAAEAEKSNDNGGTEAVTQDKAKKVFTAKQVILMVIIAVLVVIAAGTTIICAVTSTNPVTYIAGEANKGKLVNKWQSQTAPGLSAYEFFEDGTYTSYLSTYTFDGEYEVQGDNLILKNPNSNQNVVYKYSIIGDTLSLTLTDSNGDEMTGSEPNKFDRVDSFNQKSLQDIIDQYRNSASQEDQSTEADTSAAE